MKNPYLYLIMRGDMPSMNPGKLAAQAAHGASMFHEVARDMKGSLSVDAAAQLRADHWFWGYEEWVRSAKNFGTTIVLSATDREIHHLNDLDFGSCAVSDLIIDPSYPFTMDTEIFKYASEWSEGNTRVGDILPGDELFANVTDLGNGKTFATRKEVTGFWVFGEKETLSPDIGHLKLFP